MSLATQPSRLESAMNQNGQKKPVDHPTIVRIQAKAAEFAKAMPNVMKPDRFMRIAIGAIRRNPKLLECDPLSLMGSLLVAAQLGLEVNTPLGHFYLIPRYNGKTGRQEADGQIGYKGWVELLNRTGAVKDFSAHTVHENDHFEYELGDNEHITHKPAMGERGAAIAFYVIVKLINGGVRRRVLSKHDVDQYRKRSKSPNNGPWVTDYNAMALKTTFLRELPWLPLKLELQEAVSYENAIEAQASVRYIENNSQPAVDYTVPEVIEQPAIEQAQTDYLPDYEDVEPEPEPVPEPPKRRAAAKAQPQAQPPQQQQQAQPPLQPAPPASSPKPQAVSEVNPQNVKAFESWVQRMEVEARNLGYEHLTMPGALSRAIYSDLVDQKIAAPCADTYAQRRLNIAKLRPEWPEVFEILEDSFKRVMDRMSSPKPKAAEQAQDEAPWGDGGDAYQGSY